MNKQKNPILWCSLLCFVFFLFLTPQLADDLQDKPDSIQYILGITADGRANVELPGEGITDFRLYSTSTRSRIIWEYDKEFYVYTFLEDNHVVHATSIFKLLKSNGLDTFVAVRQTKNIRLQKYHTVIAIKIK